MDGNNPHLVAAINNHKDLPQIKDLQHFLELAPSLWGPPPRQPDPSINTFTMGNGEKISCILWSELFFITGTDIVKIIAYRFSLLNRPVTVSAKKFEEGIFSDLRNLRPGIEASLEEPRSPFLDFLHKNNCIRTKKKQKVFYWNKVPHEQLFLDAVDRAIKAYQSTIHGTVMHQNMMRPQAYMMPPLAPPPFYPGSMMSMPQQPSIVQQQGMGYRQPMMMQKPGMMLNANPQMSQSSMNQPMLPAMMSQGAKGPMSSAQAGALHPSMALPSILTPSNQSYFSGGSPILDGSMGMHKSIEEDAATAASIVGQSGLIGDDQMFDLSFTCF